MCVFVVAIRVFGDGKLIKWKIVHGFSLCRGRALPTHGSRTRMSMSKRNQVNVFTSATLIRSIGRVVDGCTAVFYCWMAGAAITLSPANYIHSVSNGKLRNAFREIQGCVCLASSGQNDNSGVFIQPNGLWYPLVEPIAFLLNIFDVRLRNVGQ